MGRRHTTHSVTISWSMQVVMRDLSCSTLIIIMVNQITNGSLSMTVLLVMLSIQQIKKTQVIVRSIIELYSMPIRNNVYK